MSAAAADRVLPGPAVVLGSLPPEGRDLDLLVPRSEVEQVHAALADAGWKRFGDQHVLFGEGTAYAVDVVALERRLPGLTAARRLWEESVPLTGYDRLRAPAPAHRLLLLAQRLDLGLVVDAERAAELSRYPATAWEQATTLAPQWGLADQLAELERARELPRPPAASQRHRGARSRVVALSGLDGAGKSTQAEHLAAALEALGHEVVVEWNKLGRDRSLDQLAAPVKAVMGAVASVTVGGSGDTGAPPASPDPDASPDPGPLTGTAPGRSTSQHTDEAGETRRHPDGPRPPAGPATRLRQRSAVLTWGWTIAVALANARTHHRVAAGHAGRVVVCDRYVLDTAAHLRYRYPTARRFRLQQALNRWLSPTPRAAVFLDVEPAEARRRKPEQYTTRDLVRLRELYLEEAERLGVVVVDAGLPEHEVAARVAEVAWRALATPSRLGALRAAVRRRVRTRRRG